MTLDAIKEAIQHLPEEDRRKLAGWFETLEEAAWDAEIERDFAPGGRGEALQRRIRRKIAEGQTKRGDTLLPQRWQGPPRGCGRTGL